MKKLYTLILFALGFQSFSQNNTNGDWRPHGLSDFPYMINWQIAGVARISQLKFHPTDPNIMYAVNAMGGLFITKDKGENWTPCNTDFLPQTRCASVCIDPTNDQTIYFGTGDLSYYSDGLGIWKSTDGGSSWTQKNANIGNRLVVEMIIPSGSNALIAATRDGIWKTTDGGNTWNVKKSGGSFTDMVIQPGNANVLLATTHSQMWRSTDQGESWYQVSMPGAGIEGGGRIAFSKSNASIVYASYVGNNGNGTATPVLKSTDGGASFYIVKNAGTPNLNGYDGNSNGQGNYNFGISVSPTDPNLVMICGHLIWKSTNGGANWNQVNSDWAHEVHTDMRQIPFSPFVSNEVYNINDGGIWRSWDNGESWLPLCNGLMGTECYIGSQSPVNKGAISMGAQDNGEFIFYNGHWFNNGGGDYHSNIIHDNISANYYYDLSGGGRRRGLPSGPDYDLNLPFDAGNGQGVFSSFPTNNTQSAFLGYKDVFRTTNLSNNPPTWTQITWFNKQVKAVASDPNNANILYVVTDDNIIRRSDNALAASPTFTSYTAPGNTNINASVVVMKNNSNILYLLCNNKVFRSDNKGANWTNVSANLPNMNYVKLLHDPYSTNEAIYLAGYSTMMYKDNSMTNWVNFSKGLPTVVNFHRSYIYADGTNNSEITMISAGRGVWHTGLYGKMPVLREPENPENTITGLVYNYYEGTYDFLPNFNSLTPKKTGSNAVPDVSPRQKDDNYAINYDGFIDIPEDGKYTFYLNSDDGSAFYIGTELVIDNNGLHGNIEKSGYMWLKKGKHKITVSFFQKGGGATLGLAWEGPSIAKQTIPSTQFYRLSPECTCPDNGKISVERWENIGGTAVSNILVNNPPTKTFQNPTFESKTDEGDNYGVRYRGYFCAPYSGKYTFYIASDDASELWLSTTGNPANRVKICYLNNAVNQRNWFANTSQKSAPVTLKGGQKYYIEGLHKEGGGGDNFAVAVVLPSGEFEVPVSGRHLSPFKNGTAPTVAITTPSNNTNIILGNGITINANAADAGGSISKVEFYADEIKIGEDNSAPFSFIWTKPTDGIHALTVKATDNDNLNTVSEIVNVGIYALRTPENPALTKPNLDYKYYEFANAISKLPDFNTMTPIKTGTNTAFNINIKNKDDKYGIVYTGLIDIPTDGIYTFSLASDDGAKVLIGDKEIIVNDGIHGNNYEVTGTIGLKKGKHAISLNFFQNAGGQGLKLSYEGPNLTKTEIPSTVLFREITSNTPPIVSVKSSATSAVAPAQLTISSTATDNDGTITKIELYINNTLTKTITTNSLTYNWTNISTGNYTIYTKAYDDNNAVTQSNTLTIKVVNNISPTVSIQSPTQNQVFEYPTNVSINVTATDSDGSIAKVELYNGTILLTTLTKAPYNFTWSPIAGNYTLTAKAYDDKSSITTSSPISITINDKITATEEVVEETAFALQIFPNPVFDYGNIIFDLSETTTIDISILDMRGITMQEVISKKLTTGSQNIPIDVSTLNEGTYFIRIKIGDKITTQKIIKGSKPKNITK